MNNYFLILDNICQDYGWAFRAVKLTTSILYIATICILILFTVFEFFQLVTGKTDQTQKTNLTNNTVKRIIYTILILILPSLLSSFFSILPIKHDTGLGNAIEALDCLLNT